MQTIKVRKTSSSKKAIINPIKVSEKLYNLLIDNANVVINYFDTKGRYILLNRQGLRNLNLTNKEDILGKSLHDVFPKKVADFHMKRLNKILAERKGAEFEDMFKLPTGEYWFASNIQPVFDDDNKIIGIQVISVDITERKKMEQELQRQKFILEQKNFALTELVDQVEKSKNKIKDEVMLNVNEILFPILEKMKSSHELKKYIDLFEYHLERLVSSFGRPAVKRFKLTPKEMEICQMLEGNLSSKEIAKLLNISCQTVEKHRKDIRKKLHITNKNINLVTYLREIE